MAVLSQHIPNALLNPDQFETDIKQGVVEKRIWEDHQSDTRSGVNGPPTFFINGTRYDGSPDYDSLLATSTRHGGNLL